MIHLLLFANLLMNKTATHSMVTYDSTVFCLENNFINDLF